MHGPWCCIKRNHCTDAVPSQAQGPNVIVLPTVPTLVPTSSTNRRKYTQTHLVLEPRGPKALHLLLLKGVIGVELFVLKILTLPG